MIIPVSLSAQENHSKITQTIRGVVRDEASAAPIPYATVHIPAIFGKGVTTNEQGEFELKNVPLGRHNVEVSIIGYETVTLREILVTSAKEVFLDVRMKEQITVLGHVVVRPRVNKEEPINPTATAGARMLSMEEANRYAGGADDPARLVTAFPGISSGLSHNGISIHGNSPEMLQWKLEGVEIPNPNHYADVSTFGGGIMSSLSSNVMGNSDFFSGAFPAEYGNAVSGVFDMRMRNGNSYNFEHTAQLGLMGIDLASEGPLSKKHISSYLINYRYSTMGLITKLGINGDLGGVFDYQDLNFKLNFPTKAGTFSLWATGLIDKFQDDNPKDPADWIHNGDNMTLETEQYMGAAGLSHHIRIGSKGYLKTTLAATYYSHQVDEQSIAGDLSRTDYSDMFRRKTNFILTSAYNHKFGAVHTNRTGLTYTRLVYKMDLQMSPFEGQPMETLSKGDGQTDLINVYSNSTLNLSNRLTANVGINGQFLTLNNSWSVEPRVGLKYLAGNRSTFALAYGLHSRMENVDLYYVRTATSATKPVNTDLGFTKAHHILFTYSYKTNENTVLRIEPFYQHLFDIPVEKGTSFSTINREHYWVEKALVNEGVGRNYGLDLTLEQYLNKGFYYMVTASVFDSKYKGGDGIWHNTRYNRNYIVNALAGKEWTVGRARKNTLNVNVKFTFQGGERHTPIDLAATEADPDKDIQYDETRAFSLQYDPMFITNLGASYRINRPKAAYEIGLAFINLTGTKERYGFHYNHITNGIEENYGTSGFKNVYFRVNF